MHSRDILHKAKGDHLDRVHSNQVVLEINRGEAGPCYRRPRVSKLTQRKLSGFSSLDQMVPVIPRKRLVPVGGG